MTVKLMLAERIETERKWGGGQIREEFAGVGVEEGD